MAASSSDDSSRAPDNFYLSSSNEGCNQSYCLKCPLCGTFRKYYYCINCVRNGDFVHSAHHLPEKLCEKQQKYLHLQKSLIKCNEHCEKLLLKWRKTENLKFEIKKKQEKIALLNHLIKGTKEEIIERKSNRDHLKTNNHLRCNILPKYENKVKKLEDYVLDRQVQIERLKEQNNELLANVKCITRGEIQKLTSYIFPIAEVILKDENTVVTTNEHQCGGTSNSSSQDNSGTVAALAEAKNTSYIRGKWVFHGSGISEMQYRIVAPSLPANGDYSAYSNWLIENKDDSKTNEIIPSRVSAYRIVGALTYTTQLTNLLSFYLNVRLPYKLAYGDFSKKLNEEQFSRRVSRLNTNIMYLAYTQRVKLKLLNEKHTLENLLTILNTDMSDLGRVGPNEVHDAPLMNSIDSILLGMDTGTESESEDENSLRLDWEAVPPNLPPPQDISHQPTVPLPNQQTTSIMASAANSLASMFFRGWK